MKIQALVAVLFATALTVSSPSVFAEEKPVTEQLVDTLTTLSGGPHAGYRANHAKGVMV